MLNVCHTLHSLGAIFAVHTGLNYINKGSSLYLQARVFGKAYRVAILITRSCPEQSDACMHALVAGC